MNKYKVADIKKTIDKEMTSNGKYEFSEFEKVINKKYIVKTNSKDTISNSIDGMVSQAESEKLELNDVKKAFPEIVSLYFSNIWKILLATVIICTILTMLNTLVYVFSSEEALTNDYANSTFFPMFLLVTLRWLPMIFITLYGLPMFIKYFKKNQLSSRVRIKGINKNQLVTILFTLTLFTVIATNLLLNLIIFKLIIYPRWTNIGGHYFAFMNYVDTNWFSFIIQSLICYSVFTAIGMSLGFSRINELIISLITILLVSYFLILWFVYTRGIFSELNDEQLDKWNIVVWFMLYLNPFYIMLNAQLLSYSTIYSKWDYYFYAKDLYWVHYSISTLLNIAILTLFSLNTHYRLNKYIWTKS